MKIEKPGKYMTRDGKSVTIVRVDGTTSVGRIEDDPEPLVWDNQNGEAIGHSLDNSLADKKENLPSIAFSISQTLSDLGSDKERLQVINMVGNNICIDCGKILEPGLRCRCQDPAPNPKAPKKKAAKKKA